MVRDLDALSAGARQHAEGLLLSAWRFPPFVITLRTDGQLIVESALPLAKAHTAMSDPDVMAVDVVSTGRGHVMHWLRTRMQHRLSGPRLEVVSPTTSAPDTSESTSPTPPPVESIVEDAGPLARQFEIDADRATDPRL